jgi:hypothetical protein
MYGRDKKCIQNVSQELIKSLTQIWLFISLLQMVSKQLHILTIHAVIFRTCFYKEKCKTVCWLVQNQRDDFLDDGLHLN